MFADDEDCDCPLCMEEFDLSDRGFRPCPCGYQICRFCWHHIKQNLNGRCPACRSLYSEQTVQFVPISQDEVARMKKEKKIKERRQKELEMSNRKHLSNTRVVQKNLMYVLGLTAKYANEESDLFRQFGKVTKIVISKRHGSQPVSSEDGQSTVGIYVTYSRKEDAAKAISGLDGITKDGHVLRASYGTTKYCTYYLSHMPCPNPSCMYLHEQGEESDSYNKENLSINKQQLSEVQKSTSSGTPLATNNVRKTVGKDSPSKPQVQKSATLDTADDKPALPAKARWATSWTTTEAKVENSTGAEITPDHFGPSLSDALTLPQKPKHSPSLPKRKEKRIPRSSKAVRLDMIDAAILAPTTTVAAATTPEIVDENEKEDIAVQKEEVKITEAIKPADEMKMKEHPAPTIQEPKAPKGWAIIPTVKPETAKPPALAKLGQIPLPTRGEKRPRADNTKRKEKRQHQQQKSEQSKDQLPDGTINATTEVQMKMEQELPVTEPLQIVQENNHEDLTTNTGTTAGDQHKSSDIPSDSDIIPNEQDAPEGSAVVPSVSAAAMDKNSEVLLEAVSIVEDTADNEDHVPVDRDVEIAVMTDIVQDSIVDEECPEDLNEEDIDLVDDEEDVGDTLAITMEREKLRGIYGTSDSEVDDQSSFEFDGEEDIEKLLSDEVEEEFDLIQSYPAKQEEHSMSDNRNLSQSFDEGSINTVNQHDGIKPMKMPPGLGYPNLNPPMTPPFGFNPLPHQPLPPFMHRGFPPGLMPPPGMLPRGYDPFMGQDAEMMMARRLQHSQQMIAALGMMNTGDRPRGPPNLPPPPPIPMPMHGPPGVPPQPHLTEHPSPLFHSGPPLHGQLHGHPPQSPYHSPFGYRGDSPSPLRDASIPPPHHSPYHQVTQAQDIQPLQQSSLPETNQVRSMQEGFRALLPNVNISFGPAAGGDIQKDQHISDDINQPQGKLNDNFGMHSNPGQVSSTPSFPLNQPSNNMSNLDPRNRHEPLPPHLHYSAHQSPTNGHRTNNTVPPLSSQPPVYVSNTRNSEFNDLGDSQQRQQELQRLSFPPGFGPQQPAVTDISNELQKLQLSPLTVDQGRSSVSSQDMGTLDLKQTLDQRESDKDIRTEAQNFFGNFLKQAAAHQQQSEKSNDTSASMNAPFNDPAIMAARVVSPPQNTMPPSKYSDPMQPQIHSHQFRRSPGLPQNQPQDHRNIPMEPQSYQQGPPMFSPPPNAMANMMQPPYAFHNTMQGPPGMPPPPASFMHGPPPGAPPQQFPMLPPDMRVPPPGMSSEEHHHRMEQFMRANSGSL